MGEDLCYRDPTLGLQALYNTLKAGPGTSVIEPAATQLGKLGATLAGSPARLQNALRRAEANWHGPTATAAAAALQRAGDWATKGGEATHIGTGRISDYAASFATLKSQVAAPVAVPNLSFFGRIADNFGAMSDHSKAIKQNTENAVAAYRALAEHERRTNAAIGAFPDIATPPAVTQPTSHNPLNPGGRPATPPAGATSHGGQPTTNGAPPGGAVPTPHVSSSTETAGQSAPVLPSPPNSGSGTTNTPTLTPGPGAPGTPGIFPRPIERAPTGGEPPATRTRVGDRTGTLGRGNNAWTGAPEPPMRPRGLGIPAGLAGGSGFEPGGLARPTNAPQGLPPFWPGGQQGRKDQQGWHYNDTFLPSSELFDPPLDDVVSSVITPDELDQ